MATIAPAMPIGSRSLLRPTLFVALVAACIAALIQSFFIPLDCDVSWLITVNEKLLAGQRAYVDFIEVNPPASIWLYTPAVWIAHLLRLRPEAVVASLAAEARRRGGTSGRPWQICLRAGRR